MAVYTQVPAEEMAAFVARFGVGDLISAKGIAEGVENSNYLLDTTQSRFILTLYEKRVDPADLPFFMALLDHLAAAGLPVPRALKDRDGVQIHDLAGRKACLIEFLSGVSPSHPTPAQARAAGRSLGALHEAVRDFAPVRANSMGAGTWRSLYERCGTSLDAITPGLHAEIGATLAEVLGRWPAEGTLPRSAIHADLFPDNVLMRGDAVSGLIDFYFACTDFRLYDLAVTHTAWAFDASGREHDAPVGDALIAGYEEHFPLSTDERAIFPTLAIGSCIRFTLSRAFDWINTPAGALVTRKDPLAFWQRVEVYARA